MPDGTAPLDRPADGSLIPGVRFALWRAGVTMKGALKLFNLALPRLANRGFGSFGHAIYEVGFVESTVAPGLARGASIGPKAPR